jgi:hypothetical protein
LARPRPPLRPLPSRPRLAAEPFFLVGLQFPEQFGYMSADISRAAGIMLPAQSSLTN